VVLVDVNATEANYFTSGVSLSGILAM